MQWLKEAAVKGIPPRLLQFWRGWLQLQADTEKQVGKVKVTPRKLDLPRRTPEGAPAFTFKDLTINWDLLGETLAKAASMVSQYADLFENAEGAKAVLGTAATDLKECARAWYEGTRSGALPTDSPYVHDPLLQSILHAAMRPFLVVNARAIIEHIDLENWRRGYCPVCGGNPDFAYLEAAYGARWLVCSRCDSEWPFQRLQCPHCGTTKQSALSYFTGEGTPYRLYVCDECRHYIKAVDLRQTRADFIVALERLLTMDLDLQAQKDGYLPCGHAGSQPGAGNREAVGT